MYHRTRWTREKIGQRLELIAPLIYRKQKPLPSFRYLELDGPLAPAPTGTDVDESGWETNLLEGNGPALRVENDSIQLNPRPYQIMTIRLKEKRKT